MSIHGRRESLERTLTEVVTTASQVFISVVWILRWVHIYYSNDISYKTNTTWIFSIFSIFSCKKTFILYFSLETFNFSEIIAHRKILHRNPSLQKKKIWFELPLCSVLTKDLLLLSRWWTYSCIPNSDKIHLIFCTYFTYLYA